MAKEMIKEHEGRSLDVYRDSRGKKTVGYGHLIDADSPEDIRNLKVGEKISAERAEQLFNEDYAYHARAAENIPGFSRASETQQEALIDLTFNMGPAWHEDFPKFAKAFKEGDYEKAAQELKDSDWYDQVGRRAPTIISMIETKSAEKKDDKPKGKVDFDRIVVGPETKVAQAKPKVNYQNIIVIPDSAKESLKLLDELENERVMGLATEVGEGITLGLLGELAAVAEAATTDRSYQEAKDNYELARKRFKRENPGLATYAVPLELAATIPTGLGVAKTLGKAGIKSATGQLGIEGAGYGLATGESFEERVANAGVGGFTGLALGRVIDVATSPSKAGGLKTQKDFEADASLDVDSVGEANRIQQAELQRFFDEVDDPAYRRKPLSEAETVGELWSGLKTSAQNFYNQQLRGVSDTLWAEVSPQIGAGVQRADTAALTTMNKEFSELSEALIPVIKAINESERAKGALLDYAAGKMTDPDTLRRLNTFRAKVKKTTGAKGKKLSDKIQSDMRRTATNRLMKELKNDLTADQRNILRRYIEYSARKNKTLNENCQ